MFSYFSPTPIPRFLRKNSTLKISKIIFLQNRRINKIEEVALMNILVCPDCLHGEIVPDYGLYYCHTCKKRVTPIKFPSSSGLAIALRQKAAASSLICRLKEVRVNAKAPCIAIIVSDNIRRCRDFLYHYHLNPNCFKMANSIEALRGIDKNTPIIITHCNNIHDKYFEMRDFIVDRFTNVRYIDY